MKVLIAVDGTRATRAVLSTYEHLLRRPDEVVLLNVQRLEGESLMIDMLGEAELSTLKNSLAGTEHQQLLDDRASRIIDHYRSKLSSPETAVKGMVRAGRPADEILAVASAEGADLIILGASVKKRLDRLITGSVAGEVEKLARVPVLRARRVVVCEEPYSWGDARAAIAVCSCVALGLFLLQFIVH
ncbi:MAG TPA: universal stress protein [Candidatus Methanoperedens sp.]|nr:universal stress protein [Candidatus Methanoperedens sp.]